MTSDDASLAPRLDRIRLFYTEVATQAGAVAAIVDALMGALVASPAFAPRDHRDRTREAAVLSAPVKVCV